MFVLLIFGAEFFGLAATDASYLFSFFFWMDLLVEIEDTTLLIEKEEIKEFKFPEGDVLKTEEERAERQSRILKGTQLGNRMKRKVKIIFEDVDGLKKVETTIWGFTDKNVILKKTTIIPIRCVHEVKFY
jgi:hypothetical protein